MYYEPTDELILQFCVLIGRSSIFPETEMQITEHCFGFLPLGHLMSETRVNFSPLSRNGVDCAVLKVWISLGQTPLTAVGTLKKVLSSAFHKLRSH